MSTFRLEASAGGYVELIEFGATLSRWVVPDREGNLDDIVLGFDSLEEYQSAKNQSFGCIPGRVANRIGNAQFTLDGTTYDVDPNHPPHHLHGGSQGFGKLMWQGSRITSAAGGDAVRFQLTSRDGDQGYPGNLTAEVIYSLSPNHELTIELRAEADAPTPVNLTNHAYFNLQGAGSGTVDDHVIQIEADQYTETDDDSIPTGRRLDVAGTPLDFRQPMAVGERVGELLKTPTNGYDHNYVLRDADGKLQKIATVVAPSTGRRLAVSTTQPGVQLYTGNYLHGQIGKEGKDYTQRGGFCLETQHFPNSINLPQFPSVVLRPGETYRHVCVYGIDSVPST